MLIGRLRADSILIRDGDAGERRQLLGLPKLAPPYTLTHLSGHLQVAGRDPGDLPALVIIAYSVADGRALSWAISTSRGEFVLGIPPTHRNESDPHLNQDAPVERSVLVVEVIDGAGVLLSRSTLDYTPGHGVGTEIAIDHNRLDNVTTVVATETLESLLVSPSIGRLQNRVRSLAESGDVRREALDVFAHALRLLELAQGMVADAAAVVSGDEGAVHRFRTVLADFGSPSVAAHLPHPELVVDLTSSRLDWPESWQIVREEAIIVLAAAAVWASEDIEDRQILLHGLGTLLAPVRWLELMLEAELRSDAAAIRTLLAGPAIPRTMSGDMDFGPGPMGPLGPPSRQWPGLPPRKIIDELSPLNTVRLGGRPSLFSPVVTVPSNCIQEGRAQAAAAQNAAPVYEIQTLSDPGACPGKLVTLKGVNFGVAGTVLFPGASGHIAATDVPLWTDKKIRVRVPDAASPGEISLRILVDNLFICKMLFPVYRYGRTIPYFVGGIPLIAYLEVAGSAGAGLDIQPGENASLSFSTSGGTGVVVTVAVRHGTTTIVNQTMPGGTYALMFPVPALTTPGTLSVKLHVQNACGAREQALVVRVQPTPNLRILGIEVVQAIQRFDVTGNGERNSVRLCAGRETVARVYVESGLSGGFNFGQGPDAVPGVTGSLEIISGPYTGGPVIGSGFCYNTGGAIAAQPAWAIARPESEHSLNFTLPANLLNGVISLRARVAGTAPLAGAGAGWTASTAYTTVTFEPGQTRQIAIFRVADNLRGLPRPTYSDSVAALNELLARNPLATDGGLIFTIVPGMDAWSITHDLNDRDGWAKLLADLEDVAGDYTADSNVIWAALVPQSGGYPLKGLSKARSTVDFAGIRLQDSPRVMAAQRGLGATFAHEFGHTLGFDHSPCGDPEGDVDYSMPGRTEDVGMKIVSGTIPTVVASGTGELMSYCDGQARWPSIKYWDRTYTV